MATGTTKKDRSFALSRDSETCLKIFDILTLLQYFFEETAVNTWFLAIVCRK